MIDANAPNWRTQWLTATRALTATPEAAAIYLDGRLKFTTAVAKALTHDDPQRDALVYGVWLEGHESPIYIGQTLEGRRRLWDLPIGESHHLANSFPPEIWSRVVAVYWGQVLSERPELATKVAASMTAVFGTADVRPAIGLGLEHLLQRRFQPLFNRRKKTRDGGWRDVAWDASASVGARASPHIGDLFEVIASIWERLVGLQKTDNPVVELSEGRVVFPGKLQVVIFPSTL